MEIDRQAMERIQGSPIALYQDPATGEMYAFCSKQCYRQWVVAEEDHAPDALSEKWGCWWCGRSVHPEGPDALDKPENRIL